MKKFYAPLFALIGLTSMYLNEHFHLGISGFVCGAILYFVGTQALLKQFSN